MAMTVVQTERLTLRTWAPTDIDAFAVLARDPRVTRYINGGRAATDEQIARSSSARSSPPRAPAGAGSAFTRS